MLVGNMLCDGRDEFFGGGDLEVLFVVPMCHRRTIEDFACVLQVGNLLLREGVSEDIFRQRLPAAAVISGDPVAGMDAESAPAPVHQFFDELVVYLALTLEHGQDLGAKDLLLFFHVSIGKTVECPVWAKQSVSDNGMEAWMKPGIIPEGVDDHNHAQNAVIEAQHGSKEDLKALPGAVAELRRELAVVFEIDAQHDGNTEYKLSMRGGIEDVIGDVLAKLNRFLLMTTRAEPASFTGKCQKVLM